MTPEEEAIAQRQYADALQRLIAVTDERDGLRELLAEIHRSTDDTPTRVLAGRGLGLDTSLGLRMSPFRDDYPDGDGPENYDLRTGERAR